jgi:hypothetical protein
MRERSGPYGENGAHRGPFAPAFQPDLSGAVVAPYNRRDLGRGHQAEGAFMAIVVRCECGKELRTGDENAGRRARCPACGRELIVPQPKPIFDAALADFEEREFIPRETSGKAIASLVLGLCSFVAWCLTGIPAIIFGILGLIEVENPKTRKTGRGMAIAGIILGSLTSFFCVPVLIALLLPAVQSAREAARRAMCVNNLKQIGLAMHNYQQTYGSFPPAATYDEAGKPLLSWRVLILPYLEHATLYNQFRLNEPWDSPHNKPLSDQVVAVFACPSGNLAPGLTTYKVVVDPRSMFTGAPSGVSLRSVTDGTASTLLVVEAASPVSWTMPDDLSLASPEPALGMGSKHPGGFDALMADGSVHFFKSSPGNPIDPRVLRALATRNGGETVRVP